MSDLLGVYQPGTTFLHRMPAGVKLTAMAVISVVVVAYRSPATSGVLVAVVLALLAVARVRLRLLARTLRGLLMVMALLTAWQAWQQGWAHAFAVVGALVGLVLLATVLTVTTSVDELLDTLTRALGPFRRLGVDPALVALAFSLMIRAIPTTLEIGRETRQAAQARGLDRNLRALLTPMVIRSVAHARATGDALHARGIADD
ncbi:energy-coupling factor transporter transmembrane component T [Nocardioides nanhaiensis]|uniref:Energy-coupling factor transporter transmembrane protein EcfT n=1 Tax=Nocardioides nanhaiensis TaxID=1476871 RepID=A0ABP8W512_9ACTN